jgi:hypothetical protein
MTRRHLVPWVLTLLLATTGTLGACSTSSNGPESFLLQTDSGLTYIKWVSNNGALAGSVTNFTADLANPNGGTATSTDFTGVLGGSAVTLNFAPPAPSSAWNGTVQGDTLKLSMIASSGAISTAVLSRATDADYSKAVAGFAAKSAAQAQAVMPVKTAVADLQTTMAVLASVLVPPTDDHGVSLIELTNPLADLQVALSSTQDDWATFRGDPICQNARRIGAGENLAVYWWATYFASDGAGGAKVTGWASTVEAAATAVDTAAANLEKLAASTTLTEPPSPTAAEGLAAAVQARAQVATMVQARQVAVANATGYPYRVKRIYDETLAALKVHGLPASCLKVGG